MKPAQQDETQTAQVLALAVPQNGIADPLSLSSALLRLALLATCKEAIGNNLREHRVCDTWDCDMRALVFDHRAFSLSLSFSRFSMPLKSFL